MKKCTMTASGKHIMKPELIYVPKRNPWNNELFWEYKSIEYLKCVACGFIDDRPPKRKGTGKV